jgi:hypothetical protein
MGERKLAAVSGKSVATCIGSLPKRTILHAAAALVYIAATTEP